MATDSKLISGPSKFDLMLALFEKKIVAFKEANGHMSYVRVLDVEILDDDGHDAWRIKGRLMIRVRDDRYEAFSRCFILFSSKDRTGTLSDIGPEKEKFEVANFDHLSEEQLRKEIVGSQKRALSHKDEFVRYLEGLKPHDRLVAEAFVSEKIARTALFGKLDHKLFMIMKSRSRS